MIAKGFFLAELRMSRPGRHSANLNIYRSQCVKYAWNAAMSLTGGAAHGQARRRLCAAVRQLASSLATVARHVVAVAVIVAMVSACALVAVPGGHGG